jgi:hypothetical protein
MGQQNSNVIVVRRLEHLELITLLQPVAVIVKLDTMMIQLICSVRNVTKGKFKYNNNNNDKKYLI